TAGSETSGSSAAPAGSSPSAGQFKLNDVSMGSSSHTSRTNASGATGRRRAASGNDLLLIASSSTSSDWSKYLNHRVEVRGTLESKESSSPSSPYGSPSSNPTSTNPTSTNPTGTSGSAAGSMTGSSPSASSYGNSP